MALFKKKLVINCINPWIMHYLNMIINVLRISHYATNIPWYMAVTKGRARDWRFPLLQCS